ncbi:MAG: peptide-methionine (R)-S-oxide reductase MsrB [Rickettsiales bacterium]
MTDKALKSNKEWADTLSPDLYRVAREKGTERPFTGKYTDEESKGIYTCACCGNTLFTSDHKFHSGCGWPSFDAPMDKLAVAEHQDHSHGMVRTEITCSKCDAHLGHVFPDGPTETGLRYCINSVSLDLKKKD